MGGGGERERKERLKEERMSNEVIGIERLQNRKK